MQVTKIVLSNGLRLITVPMPSMESVTVQVSIHAGSRHERKRANGLAHFLEHMVFKGTKKYPSAKAIAEEVDKVGGETNANTGKERTAFYVHVMEKHVDLAFDIVSQFILSPLIKREEIEKERGVIIEEIAMYEDLPMRKVAEKFEELLYTPDPLGWDIAGQKKNILAIQKRDFEDFRNRFYFSNNMVLSVAGKFDSAEVQKLAGEYFGGIRKMEDARLPARQGRWKVEDRKKSIHSNQGRKPAVKLIEKKTEQAHMILGVRGNPLGHKDRYSEAVLATILGSGMSSRLFTEVREKRGLAYYVKCELEHFIDNGYLATAAGIRLEKAQEAVKVIVEEYGKVSSQGKYRVGEAELAKAKEQVKGHLALSLESTGFVADMFGDQELFEKKIRTIDEIMAGVEAVSLGDIRRVAREFFQPARLNLAIVGPYKDDYKFQKLLKL